MIHEAAISPRGAGITMQKAKLFKNLPQHAGQKLKRFKMLVKDFLRAA